MSLKSPSKSTTLLLRAVGVWLVISVVEVIHGVTRALLLEPLTGDFRSRQIGVFTGSMLILFVTFVFAGWVGASRVSELLLVGIMWVFLTVVFELVLGRAILELSWERILSDYDVPRGGLMPFGLLFMLLAPLIANLLREGKEDTRYRHMR